jgi:hypothetical protein
MLIAMDLESPTLAVITCFVVTNTKQQVDPLSSMLMGELMSMICIFLNELLMINGMAFSSSNNKLRVLEISLL